MKHYLDNSIEKSHTTISHRIAFSSFVISFLLLYTSSCALHIDGIFLRLCTWTLPVFMYLWAQHKNPFVYLKLQTKAGLLWAFSFCVIIFGLGSILRGASGLNLSIPTDVWWNVIILVGLSEEVVFRGFILQQVEEMTESFWVGNSVQAILFTLTHVPYWLSQGQQITSGLIAFVLFAGLLLGMIFRKTESLWACMLIHSVNNFCSIALVYPKI